VKLPCVHVFRAAEVAISADRPFTMYADGDPIGELPVRVRAVPSALTVLVPATQPSDSAFSGPPPPLDTRHDEHAGGSAAAPEHAGGP